jgi:protein-S-isoprenylcysteine O-methyltransferase Ste14
MFPVHASAAAMTIAGTVNWVCLFAVSFIFPLLNTALGPYSMLPFVGVLVVAIGFIMVHVRETRGRSIEEIAQESTRRITRAGVATNKSSGSVSSTEQKYTSI